MESVELKLVANNSQAVSSIKELATESNKLYANNEKNQKRQVGLIADIEKELEKLRELQKNAMTIEHIEKYNKKIAEAKQSLDEYNKAGLAVEKQTESNIQKIGKWVAGIGLIGTLLNSLKNSFKDTVLGMNLITQAMEFWTQATYNLVTANNTLNTSLASSIAIGKQINDLRKKERGDIVDIAKLQRTYNELYFAASDRRKSDTERIQLLDQALIAHNLMVDKEIENLQEQRSINAQQLINRPKSNKLLDEEARLNVALQQAESSRWSGVKRIESLRTGMLQEGIARQMTAEEKKNTELKDSEMKAALETMQINSDVNDYLIKLDEDYFKSLDEKTKEQLERDKNYFAFELQLARENFANIKAQGKEEWDLMIENDKLKKEQAIETEEDIAEAKKELFASASDFTMSLYDRQLSKLEQNYNREIKAAGNNERLKEKIEEKYAAKKNEIARKAAIAEKLSAIFSIGINTAVAITKALPNMFLVALVAAAGALQAGTVLATPVPQYAKGGWTGEGKQRDSSGERMAGIVHEREFVVRKGPANKFRSVLEAINRDDKRMILNSFNRLTPELAGTTNNILVENTGPNKRLDEVNQNLRKMAAKEEIMIMGNLTIIKKGNSVRTIRR